MSKYIIGDLVKHKDKVIEIKEIILLRFGGYSYGDEFTWHDEESLVPIPITLEILEKNGWKKREYHVREYYDDVEWIDFCTPVTAVNLRYYPEEESFFPFCYNNELQPTEIKYVHQLQHLLFGLGLNFNMKV